MRFTTLATSSMMFSAADTARGQGTGPVAEIVTFRLNAGADPVAFAAAAQGMAAFLERTGAAGTRTLSVDDTGLWTDHITWSSMKAAKDAAAAIMDQPEAGPFMMHIDPATVTMRHAEIRYVAPKDTNASH